jgi:hypothetical protein
MMKVFCEFTVLFETSLPFLFSSFQGRPKVLFPETLIDPPDTVSFPFNNPFGFLLPYLSPPSLWQPLLARDRQDKVQSQSLQNTQLTLWTVSLPLSLVLSVPGPGQQTSLVPWTPYFTVMCFVQALPCTWMSSYPFICL